MKAAILQSPTCLRILNEARELRCTSDWQNPEASPLWLYNLHYFDDLAGPASSERARWQSALIERWIRENPPTAGVGWDPYPTSLRVVNWIKWALAGNSLPAGFERSIAQQVRWLSRRIEHHLQGNHLWANAKALTMAGLYLDGFEARSWRDAGLQILKHEVAEQVLGDGGHFELSPMYHSLLLEDVIDLLNAAATWPTAIDAATQRNWRMLAADLHSWLIAMSHPDGEISFFNDSAFGVARPAEALAEYAGRVGLELPAIAARLSDSGFRRVELEDAVLIVDVGEIGASYQPGHAHADALSFEFSLRGQRLFVNSGTSTYSPGKQRQWERSTAAHNTVEVDDSDSSEVWGGFRVARRARVSEVEVLEMGSCISIRAEHDGYKRLPGKVIHRREWTLKAGSLCVSDRIAGAFKSAVAHLYLHPQVYCTVDGQLVLPDGTRCSWRVTGGSASVHPSDWHPEFGRRLESRCVEVIFDGPLMTFELTWRPR